ncbi:MAG: serine/threonine-protein kinase, partial [Candidatus Rokuibacteriota bacterium]
MNRETQAGPAATPPVQRGERFASGLRVHGRYRVVSEIGAGAFGTVCVGEDESTGHRVAIRFFPRSFGSTPQAAQAVLRMGRSIIAVSTSHPVMARVLEFGEHEGGRPFTVTECVEGRRLSDVMSDRAPLDVAAALRIALELGGAIETLHNMGFVHGAISPRNVAVLEDGRVKLLDIELAGLRDAREVHELVNADPPAEYLSPEQIQKAPITEKTDIYAFGIILHELLSGAPPFQGSTRDAILTKHLKDPPVPVHRRREGVPASVSRAVTLALYKQPEARPLMGDVLNLLWTGAHGPAPRRKRAVAILGGAALATLAIVAVVWGVLALRLPAGSPP